MSLEPELALPLISERIPPGNTIVENLLHTMVGIVDTAMVGRLGQLPGRRGIGEPNQPPA